jgi:two-component system, NarL family, invasion response regulator UvrY
MIHILIADDHAVLRKGVMETIEEELKEVDFGEAQNGRQVIGQLQDKKWDIVLLDIQMEGRSGLEVLADVRKANPRLPVLMLSMYPEEEFAVQALKRGASGYVTKQSAPEELITAIKKILGGGRYVSPLLAERLAVDLQRKTENLPHEALSNRELEVLRMVAMGKSLKEIAADLSLSIKTIGTYHTRILEKMSMSSDVELTRYALQNKLVD